MLRLASVLGILSGLLVTLPACSEPEIEDGIDDAFPSGKADGGLEEGSADALGLLALVNDPTTTASALRSGAGVTSRVANNITRYRDGADGAFGTADDNLFDTLAELDAIPYVGPSALNALVEHARERGFIGGTQIDVIFSPQVAASAHTARIAQMIREAKHSVDIAMYSYSDAAIGQALADAQARGLKVRFLFETANKDKNLTDPAARAASKSGRLEAAGIDVRYVNKILHHKFAIIDGPRDDASRAATAKLVSGSANWSSTGGTLYDENTFFVQNSRELTTAFQHEFDALWRGSRDYSGPAAPQGNSTAGISPDDAPDEPGLSALFTRVNFTAGGSDGTTWKVDPDSLKVSDVFVDAIERAQTSIHVASGHIRLRPVAEALIAKKQAHPDLDIRVYLDQQEWISTSGHSAQLAEVAECEAAATTDAQRRYCGYNDFLFSKALVDAGIDVRFKSYAYRWNATYAIQMHSKYMVVDGSELLSGSYNLSMNAEHATFENVLHVDGPQFATLVGQFEDNFETMWSTSRDDGTLERLRSQISTDSTIPLVFPPMSLTWSELEQLRSLIRTNCTLADSTEYRSNPGAHKVCPR